MNTYEKLTRYEPESVHDQLPIVWDRASGWWVFDDKGKSYLDFTSGIFVANVGHAHPKVQEAIINQARKMMFNYTFASDARARLCEKLCELTGMEQCLLLSSGSEANDCAARLMMSYTGRKDIETLDCYYGNTYLDQQIRGKGKIGSIAGLFFQCFPGWSAEWYDYRFIETSCDWSREHQKLIAWDEMQSGFGRTGKMFGFQHYGVKPDIITVGKALGGGMPISAVLTSKEIFDSEKDLHTTQTGNPVCCAAALATLEVIEEEGLCEKAILIGEVIERKFPGAFGRGAIWALHFNPNGVYDIEFVDRIVEKAAEKGLLLLRTHRGTIKIAPPLTTPLSFVEQGCEILREAIRECL